MDPRHRRPPDASVDRAAAALNVVWRQLDEQALRPLELAPLTHGFEGARGVFAQPLVVLLIIVGLVLLIACVTVANLVLARASARQREMAVRRALGASRARIARQLVTESLLLASCAGALGLVVGLWLGTAAPRLMDLGPIRPAAQLDVRLDLRLFAFAAALSAVTVVLFGLAPAFTGSRVSLVPALKATRGTDGDRGGRFPLSRSLVVMQVALSLVLLTGAGLFVRTLSNLASLDATVGRGEVLLVWTRPGQTMLKGPALAARGIKWHSRHDVRAAGAAESDDGGILKAVPGTDVMPQFEANRPAEKPGDAPPTQAMVDRTIALAREVFNDDAAVLDWLTASNPVMGVSPVLAMRTRQGVEAVEETLQRLSHGIY